jgi:hypothetical protein
VSEPRKLRKGRDRCIAHRRDGQQCGAPAIPGGLVCRRHGGSASQVRLAGERVQLLERAYRAWLAVEQEEQGSERWRQALYKACEVDRRVKQFESDIDLLGRMRAELAEPSPLEIRRKLLQEVRERLALSGQP